MGHKDDDNKASSNQSNSSHKANRTSELAHTRGTSISGTKNSNQYAKQDRRMIYEKRILRDNNAAQDKRTLLEFFIPENTSENDNDDE